MKWHSTRWPYSFAIIFLNVIGELPATAQPINEDHKIVASDAAAGDLFGTSVAVSGTTAIVGAIFDDDAGDFTGSAYLYDTETGLELFKLTASDLAGNDQFGVSVSISRSVAIVGAIGDDDAGSGSGSAYLFDTETGVELFKLVADDAAGGDLFGGSVAISGPIAIVGAAGENELGGFTGSAYLFDTKTGKQLYKLSASDADAGDHFGASVAISGRTAIVGAPNNSDAGPFSGSAYLFDIETGDEIIKLTAPDAMTRDFFGHSVAISGMTALVGTYIFDFLGDDNLMPGSAYLFDIENGILIQQLTASDADGEDLFGSSVAISGTTAIVGAFFDDDAGSRSGSAYLYDSATGQEIFKLGASDAAAEDDFGQSVAISGTTVIVGAPNDIVVFNESGSAYIYDLFCPADLNGDFMLDFLDISLFVTSYQFGLSLGDINGDGFFDFLDISAFLSAYNEGCP